MPKDPEKGKKLVLIPNNLVSDLMQISNQQGKKFFNFMAENLRQVLRAHEAGKTLEDIVDFYQLMEVHRLSGAVMIPKEAFDQILARMYPDRKEFFQERWYNWGRLYAQYLAAKFEDPLEAFTELLKRSRWELNEVVLEQERDKVRIRCTSSILSAENTGLLTQFIQGTMHALSYETEKLEHTRGIILLEYAEA